MNKICTSIEQSKKLIELGIDVNTADMIYQPLMDIDSMSSVEFDKIPLCFPFNEVKKCNIQYLSAWSLSALLSLFDDKAGIAKEYETWFAYDNGKSHCGKHCDSPLDAAFEMIVWLKENNKL